MIINEANICLALSEDFTKYLGTKIMHKTDKTTENI
jgi:hypothetical protein